MAEKRETVLVAGGSGLIGRALCELLVANGYEVRILGRGLSELQTYPSFRWDVAKGEIDFDSVKGVDHIINLAGANIGERRWTESRKKLILSSRTGAAALLASAVTKYPGSVKTYIGASAVGYYGALSTPHVFEESDPPATDFLGSTCAAWEESSSVFADLGCRRVLLRTGVVLAPGGGIVRTLKKGVKMGFGAVAGTGTQYLPWIHIADICAIYLYALRNPGVSGIYNAAAPAHTDYRSFIHAMADVMVRRILLPPVPGWILKLLLGEMSAMVLYGSRVSATHIIESGFQFSHPELKGALETVL